MRVAIYGAGGHGKVVWDILTCAGHTPIGFVDDGGLIENLLGLPVRRQLKDLPSFDGAIVAIGSNRVRKVVFDHLVANGVPLLNAIHPSSTLSSRVTLGRGVVIAPGAIANIDTIIGDNVILNTGSTIDHDCCIGSHAHIAPGTQLGGNVVVDEGAFLGIGTRAIPGVRVGAWATCGAGSVVIKDVSEGFTVVGVPARPLVRP